jgi:hypothetical protein
MLNSGTFTYNPGSKFKHGPYTVTLPKIPRLSNHQILFQQWVLNQLENSKTLSSQGPFAILMDGKIYEATKEGGRKIANLTLVSVIVWKKRPGSDIRCDGSEEYKIPLSRAQELEQQGKIYYDLTSDSYAVDDSKVYE